MTKQEYISIINEELFPQCHGIKRLCASIRIKLTNPQKAAVYYIRKMQYQASLPGKLHSFIAQRLHMKLVNDFSMCVSPNAVIGVGLHIPHPSNIVIGNSVVIGKRCSIYQGCTIGGARIGDVKKGNQPVVGDDCVFFCGSMILGAVKVDDKVTVGANSVLLSDATEGIYVGSPARKVK